MKKDNDIMYVIANGSGTASGKLTVINKKAGKIVAEQIERYIQKAEKHIKQYRIDRNNYHLQLAVENLEDAFDLDLNGTYQKQIQPLMNKVKELKGKS